jgi:hypothetical protein
MRRRLALCFVLLAPAAFARADTVELQGGTRLEGAVLESGEKGVRILLPAGDEVLVAKADVKTVAVDPDAPGAGHYTRYAKDGAKPGLQIGVVHFEKPGAPRVDLVGVVHVADPAYFAEIQGILDREEIVLFEMVRNPDEDGAKKPEPANPAVDDLDTLRKFQKTIATLLDLSFQVDHVDYRRKHFLHADMTLDQFMAAGGGDFSKEMADQMARVAPLLNMIAKVFDPSDASEGAKKRVAMIRAMVKPMLGTLLGNMGDKAGLMLGDAEVNELIIVKRNEVAMAMFDTVVRSRTPKSVAIFYGSAHMPDFEKRLEERGYQRAGGRWLTAWAVGGKPAAAPTTTKPAEPAPVPAPAMN